MSQANDHSHEGEQDVVESIVPFDAHRAPRCWRHFDFLAGFYCRFYGLSLRVFKKVGLFNCLTLLLKAPFWRFFYFLFLLIYGFYYSFGCIRAQDFLKCVTRFKSGPSIEAKVLAKHSQDLDLNF